MGEPKACLKRTQQGASRGPLNVFCRRLEGNLCKLQVPVAEFIPDKFVDGLGGQVESISGELTIYLVFNALQLRDNPLVDKAKVKGAIGPAVTKADTQAIVFALAVH